MTKTYRQIKYGTYTEGDTAVTLRSMSGDYGGGSEVLVVEPIVFRDDITIKVDGGVLPLPSVQETSREFNV